MSTPVIEVESVTRTFPGRPAFTALSDVSFTVGQGEVVALLGANGAGKTTMTKILGTLLLPTTGRAAVNGHDVRTETRAARAATGLILGGDKGLYDRLSARKNLEFFGMLAGVPAKQIKLRVPLMLEQVNLADAADRRVETFSKGMRQRLHVAIGLIADPPVLLLDEPTVGLDPIEADRLRTVIEDLTKRGVSILLTSHQLLDVERLADRVVLLQRGQVKATMPVSEFSSLAGYAAVVTLRVRGELGPESALPADAEVDTEEEESGARVVRLRLRRWSGSVFSELGAFLGSAEVDDIAVRQSSLDEAFISFVDESRT